MPPVTAKDFITQEYADDYSLAGLEDLLRRFTQPRHGLTLPAARVWLAQRAAELALRRLLAAEGIPHENLPAAAFQEAGRFEVALGGRRCVVQAELITAVRTRQHLLRQPGQFLRRSLQFPRAEIARPTHSVDDLLLFAFVLAAVGQPAGAARRGLLHLLPAGWAAPAHWRSLVGLALKSEAREALTVELLGLDASRAYQSCTIELPPRQRVVVPVEFYTLAGLRTAQQPTARLGLHCPALGRQPLLLGPRGWKDLWLAGEQVIYAGYLTAGEFSRTAVPGAEILSLPVANLRPLAELFTAARQWAVRSR